MLFPIILSTTLQVSMLGGLFSLSVHFLIILLQADVGFFSLTHMVYPSDILHNYLISILPKNLRTCFSPYSSHPILHNSLFPFCCQCIWLLLSYVCPDSCFKSNLNSILFFLFAAELDIPISSTGLAGR